MHIQYINFNSHISYINFCSLGKAIYIMKIIMNIYIYIHSCTTQNLNIIRNWNYAIIIEN